MENEENTDLEQEIQDEVETTEEESATDEGVDYKALYEEKKREASKLKRKLFSKEEPQKPIINRSDEAWKSRMELKVEGYNDDEVNFILKNGGRKSLENPIVSSAIEVMRDKKRAEDAMISDSPKSETEKRYSPEDFSKLTAAEQEKILSSLK